MKRSSLCRALLIALLASAGSLTAQSAPHITTPKEAFGFNLGDDYQIANYTQAMAYWQKLATESDRIKLIDIGPTSENRRQIMAIISSPENIKQLDRYRDISRRLALAQDLTPDQAHALAAEGKSIVWIDGGLHSSETVGSQQLFNLVYHLVGDTDPETMRELKDDIVLCVPANPDGIEMVANWYMREPVPEKRIGGTAGNAFMLPYLWNRYAGHDDNRDFYMSNLAETTNMNHVLFREWYPQIVFNHHQPGPIGGVVFAPPFRAPFNYHYDPLIPIEIDALGMAIHGRLIEENKPGSSMRSAATYSTWFNGSLRTVTYFHNMIGLLTEITGSPNPMQLPLVPNKQLPANDLPDPVPPQIWHYRQSLEYELTDNRAVLDYASRNREQLLFDIYEMGSNSIARGSEDSWTVTPKRIAALEKVANEKKPGSAITGNEILDPALYKDVLHDPAFLDPRGYIIPSDQPDFPTATRFINTLLKNGVTVLYASQDFTVAGKHYPANSYVVQCAQAFRPEILDMFEPQDYPNDFKYPGGPPIPPYDATGYTLALQMGIHFDRVLDAFTGPFKPIATDLATPPHGIIAGAGKAGYLVSHQFNDSFILTNRLLKAHCAVFWLRDTIAAGGKELPAGALWIPLTSASRRIVEAAVAKLGIDAIALSARPQQAMLALHIPRIALFDQYNGLMPSGWIRFELEQFEFPYTPVYPQQLDAGHLRDKYDVVLLPDSAVSPSNFIGGMTRSSSVLTQPEPATIPAQFRPLLGFFTKEKTLPQIDAFVRDGGEVITIGSSNQLASALSLPVLDALTETTGSKQVKLPPEKFYIPGALIHAHFDTDQPIAYGMPATADVFFDNSPAFRLAPQASIQGAQVVAWYGQENLVASGWAWGQQYLQNTVAAVDVPLGKGSVVMLGPEVAFRGQPHATFKLLFNGILFSAARPAP